MNTLHPSEETTAKAAPATTTRPHSSNLSATARMIGLAVLTALSAAGTTGCEKPLPKGAPIADAAEGCLRNIEKTPEGQTIRENCKGNRQALVDIAFKDCKEGVPTADTKVFFLREETTAQRAVAKGADYFCDEKED